MEPLISLVEGPRNANVPASPLMTLPLELRIKIYEELLYPSLLPQLVTYEDGQYRIIPNNAENRKKNDHKDDNDEEKTFEEEAKDKDKEFEQNGDEVANRCDGQGWGTIGHCFDVYPTILRVNKQIYDEAVSFLYKRISCRIRLRSPFGEGYQYDSGFLHQIYYYKHPNDIDGYVYSMDPVTSWTWIYDFHPPPERDIKLHCLRLVQDISVHISYKHLFGKPPYERLTLEGHYLTPEGSLFLDILRYLNQEPTSAPPPRKRLHVTIEECSLDFLLAQLKDAGLPTKSRRSVPIDAKVEAVFEGLKEMVLLLRSLARSRTVIVKEKLRISKEDSIKWSYISREVDLENLAWIEGLVAVTST